MSKYPLISGKVILARVIRSLGYKLPSVYHDDVLEWIGEGLGVMRVTNTLEVTSTAEINCPGELLVTNHCVALPCGFVSLIAVEDENGNRLPLGSDETDITSQTSMRHVGVGLIGDPRVSSFQVNPHQHQTSTGLPVDGAGTNPPYYLTGDDIQDASSSSARAHYYKQQGNYIQTSFEEGFIRLHYYAMPVCSDGFPLIPDNENFKQGLEWYIIRRLIGAGHQHPVFTYDYADKQFELYAGRGMSAVSFYTPEGAARLNRSLVRLIPNFNAYEDFFINNEQPERLAK